MVCLSLSFVEESEGYLEENARRKGKGCSTHEAGMLEGEDKI